MTRLSKNQDKPLKAMTNSNSPTEPEPRHSDNELLLDYSSLDSSVDDETSLNNNNNNSSSKILHMILPVPNRNQKTKSHSLSVKRNYWDTYIANRRRMTSMKKILCKPCYVSLQRCDDVKQKSPISIKLTRVDDLRQQWQNRKTYSNKKLRISSPLKASTPVNNKIIHEPVAKRSRSSQKLSQSLFTASSRLDASEIDYSGDKTSWLEGLGLSQTTPKIMNMIPKSVLMSVDGCASSLEYSLQSKSLNEAKSLNEMKNKSTKMRRSERLDSGGSNVKSSPMLRNPMTRSPLKTLKVVLTMLEDSKENNSQSNNSISISDKSKLKSKLKNVNCNTRRSSSNKSLKFEENDVDGNTLTRKSKNTEGVNSRKRKTVIWDLPGIKEENESKKLRRSDFTESISVEDYGDEDKVVLKPRKQWRRSLSILHNMQKGMNVEEHSKYSKSMQGVLDIRSSLMSHNASIRASNKHSRRVSSMLSHRASTCVVLENNRKSTKRQLEEDPVFLAAFGIRAQKNRDSYVHDLSPTVQNENAKLCLLRRASQSDFLIFCRLYSKTIMQSLQKIGEGLYGEVFLYKTLNKSTLLKVIPIEGEVLVNGEIQKKFQEIITEVVILQELHNLSLNDYNHTSCFTELKKIRCAKGKYKKEMIKAWEEFDRKKTSENDHPSIFNSDQKYLVIEMHHGGTELGDYIFANAKPAFFAFLQIAYSIAVAEVDLEFEHRDLHLGNVLIKDFGSENLSFRIEGKNFLLPTCGIKVTIIDNTLSRCRYGPVIIYNDLEKDPMLFESTGCEQFDVYRNMRISTKKDWKKFTPFTNILWMQYLLFELTRRGKYLETTSEEHQSYMQKMNILHDEIVNYESAFKFVQLCPNAKC